MTVTDEHRVQADTILTDAGWYHTDIPLRDAIARALAAAEARGRTTPARPVPADTPVHILAGDATAARDAAHALHLTTAGAWRYLTDPAPLRGVVTVVRVHLADRWHTHPAIHRLLDTLRTIDARPGGVEWWACDPPEDWPNTRIPTRGATHA